MQLESATPNSQFIIVDRLLRRCRVLTIHSRRFVYNKYTGVTRFFYLLFEYSTEHDFELELHSYLYRLREVQYFYTACFAGIHKE